jgi:two-component system, LytTR family, response regulator
MSQKITCFVVDDDNIDRLTTLSFLKDYPQMEVTGDYDSAEKALSAAQKTQPEVLFLDIDMPGMSGLELRKKLAQVPACVFITAFPDYAVESFEVAAFDFLVKPYSAKRFAVTMERLQDYINIRHKSELLNHTLGADTIFIKDGHQQVKLQLHEIIYLEALKDYTRIVTLHHKYAVLSPLGNLIKEKAFSSFVRIHRSYAVQKNYIKNISSGEVTLNNHITLPIGRSFKITLQSLF